ncbi:MAG: hypothetical protein KF819_37280 [Labilithrix sp.]|nr:hypothetical protein [Labilithrix sp.]
MIDEEQARQLAQAAITFDDVALGVAREIEQGWFFRWATPRIGCNGVIVNKKTGRLFHLGSAFPVERDLALYDRGYQFKTYDLVITATTTSTQRDGRLDAFRSRWSSGSTSTGRCGGSRRRRPTSSVGHASTSCRASSPPCAATSLWKSSKRLDVRAGSISRR